MGQFSLLNLFFPEYNFNYKKTVWVSLGGFSSTVGARPFFYCDLAFCSWLPSAKEVPCLSTGISKEGTLLCLATSSNIIFYDVKETDPRILSSWKRDGNFLHLQRQKIKSSSEGLSLPPPYNFILPDVYQLFSTISKESSPGSPGDWISWPRPFSLSAQQLLFSAWKRHTSMVSESVNDSWQRDRKKQCMIKLVAD